MSHQRTCACDEGTCVRCALEGWTDAGKPPPEDKPDCIVRMDDDSERSGSACYAPNGDFVGWMFECRMLPDDNERKVVAWKY